jgi:hypothetical protein
MVADSVSSLDFTMLMLPIGSRISFSSMAH